MLLDNDANAAVFGEQWQSPLSELHNVIYLYSGAGCGFLIDGQIYRGNTGSAGEGLFDLEHEHPQEGVPQAINSGEWAIDLGISRRARNEVNDNKNSILYRNLLGELKGDVKNIDFKMVVECANSNDTFSASLIKDAGKQLGQKAALLVNLLNPGMIIVGGGLEIAGVPFLEAVTQEIKRRAIPEATEKLKIAPSQLGDLGVALGAAALVIQNYFVEG